MSKGEMRVTASSGEGKPITTKDVWKKPPQMLEIPIREIGSLESIVLGFRMDMFDLTDDQGNGGSMTTGAGLGNDAISMTYKKGKTERQAVVKGTELIIAWIATFDAEMAEDMRKAMEKS